MDFLTSPKHKSRTSCWCCRVGRMSRAPSVQLGAPGYVIGLFEFSVRWWEHLHVRVRASACVNSRPAAHFTHRQTSKAVWINPACRGHSACHSQFHISVAPAAPNVHGHSYWNNKWSFAMHRIAILRCGKIKLQKSRDVYGSVCWIFLFLFRLRSVAGEVKVFCVCFKSRQSAGIMFVKAGQSCFHYSPSW